MLIISLLFLGANIRTKLMDILQNFGCNLDEDQPVIVMDRGSNMISKDTTIFTA